MCLHRHRLAARTGTVTLWQASILGCKQSGNTFASLCNFHGVPPPDPMMMEGGALAGAVTTTNRPSCPPPPSRQAATASTPKKTPKVLSHQVRAQRRRRVSPPAAPQVRAVQPLLAFLWSPLGNSFPMCTSCIPPS